MWGAQTIRALVKAAIVSPCVRRVPRMEQHLFRNGLIAAFTDTTRSGPVLLGVSIRSQHAQPLLHRIVEAIDDAFLERDDGVVGDRDVLWAHLRAALRDVAVTNSEGLFQLVDAVLRVGRVHLQSGGVDEEPRADELVVLPVVAQDVADVLAEEALNALPELLDPVDVLLLHPPRAAWRLGLPGL